MAAIKVSHPFQVSLAGVVYRPGEVVDVPLHVATVWTENGWVEAVIDDDSATAK